MDRKAWIVLIVCGILLALNMHYAGKANLEKQRQELADKADKEKAAKENPADPVDPANPAAPVKPVEPTAPEVEHILRTESNAFTLSSKEGGIVQAEFLQERAVHGESNVTMNDLGLHRIGALTTISGQSLEKNNYKISNEQSEDSITFIGKTDNNLIAKKIWSKTSEGAGQGHRLTLKLILSNDTPAEISIGKMALFTGSAAPVHDDERENYLNFFWQEDGDFDSETSGYFGKMFGDDLTEYRDTKEDPIQFAGVENQFFATIVSPAKAEPGTFRVIPKKVEIPSARGNGTLNSFHTFLTLPDDVIPAGQTREFTYDIFVGPKNNGLIRSLDGDKADVMDYGMFGWISCPLNWTLNKLATLFGATNSSNNWAWGWAIIVLTLIIRTIMWPLHAKSTRTMKRMSKLQPKMKALKEKYPDDPQKVNQETMKLYREFGINPMGGCLPMLFQIPVFFGFYNMLQYAVELRNQPFLGWVNDLSQPDTVTTIAGLPINILPILMAVTMVIQMNITPKTGDKMQQRIFMLMPLIFFFFCYNFASALALYWTTQNIFSIGQTWLMQKMPEPDLKTSAKAGKKSWMQKLAERAEEAQKLRQAQQKGGRTPAAKQAKPKKPRGPKTGG